MKRGLVVAGIVLVFLLGMTAAATVWKPEPKTVTRTKEITITVTTIVEQKVTEIPAVCTNAIETAQAAFTETREFRTAVAEAFSASSQNDSKGLEEASKKIEAAMLRWDELEPAFNTAAGECAAIPANQSQ